MYKGREVYLTVLVIGKSMHRDGIRLACVPAWLTEAERIMGERHGGSLLPFVINCSHGN